MGYQNVCNNERNHNLGISGHFNHIGPRYQPKMQTCTRRNWLFSRILGILGGIIQKNFKRDLRHTVQKKLTGRHNLPQTCAPWRIFIRKVTNFVTFLSWIFGQNFLKSLLHFGRFMTNYVNLDSLIIWKKWQNLPLFWKSFVELIFDKKNFLWLMWELNQCYLGFGL